jgi:hypothetical protein
VFAAPCFQCFRTISTNNGIQILVAFSLEVFAAPCSNVSAPKLQTTKYNMLDAPTALAVCCGFDMCLNYILYFHFQQQNNEIQINVSATTVWGPSMETLADPRAHVQWSHVRGCSQCRMLALPPAHAAHCRSRRDDQVRMHTRLSASAIGAHIKLAPLGTCGAELDQVRVQDCRPVVAEEG